ncbi:hypothetical protein D6D20_06208 [Aureobasidium pullulans]|uniref:Uncharacterized protein n=1 Tax=Aureobasidium pullulans TaxID=5580 RepID=A0A4S8Z375_AURPU|nr:hypothetical protein D6D20_06208 [Aureobasidium pullulans]
MPPLHENMTDYEILQEEISLKVQELEVLRRKLAIEDIKRRRKEKKRQQDLIDENEEVEDEKAENEDGDDTGATNAGRAASGFGASVMEVDMKNDATNAVVIKPEPEDDEVRPAGFINMTLKKTSKPSNPSSKPVGLVFNDEKLQAPPPPKQPLRRTRCSRQRNLAPELPMPDPARELNRPPTKRPAITAAASSSPHSSGSPNPSSREPKVKAEDKTEAQPPPLSSKRQKTASTPSLHTSPSPPFLTPPSRHLSSPSLPAPPSPAASSSSYASSPSPPRKPSLSPPVENALSFSFEAGDVPQEPRPAYSGTQINKERERGKKGEKRKIVMLGVDGRTKVVEG